LGGLAGVSLVFGVGVPLVPGGEPVLYFGFLGP